MSIQRRVKRKEDTGYKELHRQVELFFAYSNGKNLQERMAEFYSCNSSWKTFAIKKNLSRLSFEDHILKERDGILLSGIEPQEKQSWIDFYNVLKPQIEAIRMQRQERNRNILQQGAQKEHSLSLFQTLSINYKKFTEWLKR